MALNQDTREVVIFVAELFEGIGKSIEDGKVTFADAFNFNEALQAAIPAFSGINNVKLADLKKSENRDELIQLFSDRFDIPQDKLEKKVEKYLRAISSIVDIIMDFA